MSGTVEERAGDGARPRRVLHLIDTAGPGGAETVFMNLVRKLPPERWNSTAVVPWSDDWLHDRLLEEGVRPRVLRSHRSFDLGYLRALRRIVLEVRPHLIQTHLLTTAVYGSALGRLTGVPTVSTFHGVVDADRERFRSVKLRIVDRPQARTVFVSDHLRSWFLENSPLGEERTRVIHNGISFADDADHEARAAWRRRLEVDPDTVLIGAVGNIRRAKDYGTLVRAVRFLASRTSAAVRCVVAGHGDGARRRKLERLVDELGLDDRFRFLGFVSEVSGLLAALDVFALSSFAEGFSLSTVEAMASGLPVVVTRSGGPEEIVEDGRSGRLVPPRDPEALAEALRELVESEEERRRLGQVARGVVRRRFSLDAMIRGYERVYDELTPMAPGDAVPSDLRAARVEGR